MNEKVGRQEYWLEKLKYAAKQFGKAGTTSEYPGVPKEQQLSIDLGNRKIFGIINRILHWIESKFTYFFARYNLFPEVGTKERKVPWTNTKVKYFTPNEQAEHALYIGEENGDLKLYDSKGKLYDTTGKISKGKKGYVAYVLTLDGRLITHEHINAGKEGYAYRHSTLAGGKPIICSGLIQVIDGKITYIDNNSGHYKPEAANVRNAVEKFKELFSENAKVVCFGYFKRLLKQIPFIRKIPIPTKKESVENFLERMEEKGEDGLTEYERYFAKVKKDNQEYANQLDCQSVYTKVVSSNYEPIPISDSNNPREVKMIVEHSIRKIIGAGYGHKPKIDVERYNGKTCGISVTFHDENDRSRFIEVLDSEQCSYVLRTQENKYKITMSTEQANEFIKDGLKIEIDSIKQLDTITRGHSIRSAG
ncbi:hypothetical protein ASM33_08005 [Wolbachia endosymbiont of Folsomia candida]|nr:hypothetical protein ASM33_08005 [Wolbachia endosymbiont of Folsomia candida]